MSTTSDTCLSPQCLSTLFNPWDMIMLTRAEEENYPPSYIYAEGGGRGGATFESRLFAIPRKLHKFTIYFFTIIKNLRLIFRKKDPPLGDKFEGRISLKKIKERIEEFLPFLIYEYEQKKEYSRKL